MKISDKVFIHVDPAAENPSTIPNDNYLGKYIMYKAWSYRL